MIIELDIKFIKPEERELNIPANNNLNPGSNIVELGNKQTTLSKLAQEIKYYLSGSKDEDEDMEYLNSKTNKEYLNDMLFFNKLYESQMFSLQKKQNRDKNEGISSDQIRKNSLLSVDDYSKLKYITNKESLDTLDKTKQEKIFQIVSLFIYFIGENQKGKLKAYIRYFYNQIETEYRVYIEI